MARCALLSFLQFRVRLTPSSVENCMFFRNVRRTQVIARHLHVFGFDFSFLEQHTGPILRWSRRRFRVLCAFPVYRENHGRIGSSLSLPQQTELRTEPPTWIIADIIIATSKTKAALSYGSQKRPNCATTMQHPGLPPGTLVSTEIKKRHPSPVKGS
jgi:hypothetical protein